MCIHFLFFLFAPFFNVKENKKEVKKKNNRLSLSVAFFFTFIFTSSTGNSTHIYIIHPPSLHPASFYKRPTISLFNTMYHPWRSHSTLYVKKNVFGFIFQRCYILLFAWILTLGTRITTIKYVHTNIHFVQSCCKITILCYIQRNKKLRFPAFFRFAPFFMKHTKTKRNFPNKCPLFSQILSVDLISCLFFIFNDMHLLHINC